jgi:hypothetical protein
MQQTTSLGSPNFAANPDYQINTGYSVLGQFPSLPSSYTNPQLGTYPMDTYQGYSAFSPYDTASNQLNLYGQQFGSNNMADQSIQYAADGTPMPYKYGTIQGDAGALDMMRARGQSVLANNYFQTPGYQLLFGSGMQQMDPRLSPTERYVASPGYQWQQDEAARQLQRNASSRGLLESGATQRDLLQQSQGLALQDYQNWWNTLSGNYDNYQNRLAALASAGMGMTGGDNAMALGQGNAAGSYSTGNNIGSLLANQGTAGLGAYMNTGAGMASNVMQGLQTQAQIDSAKSSGGGGAGQIAGQAMSLIGGLF